MSDFEEGQENVGILVYARPDGRVSMKLFQYENGERGEQLQGLVLPPATARSVAENLTLASWKAEDMKKWQDDQLEP